MLALGRETRHWMVVAGSAQRATPKAWPLKVGMGRPTMQALRPTPRRLPTRREDTPHPLLGAYPSDPPSAPDEHQRVCCSQQAVAGDRVCAGCPLSCPFLCLYSSTGVLRVLSGC